MLTLGKKHQVINLSQIDRIKVLDENYVEATTDAAAGAAKYLEVEGFGLFDIDTAPSVMASRGVDRVKGSLLINAGQITYTPPTVPTQFVVDVETRASRNNTTSGRNVIEHGSHIVITTTIVPTDTTLDLVFAKVKAAFDQYPLLWPNADLVIETTVAGTNTATATIQFETADYETDIKRIQFLSSTEGNRESTLVLPTIFTENLPVGGATVVKGHNGINTGKYLEENILMGTTASTDIYGVRRGEVPSPDAFYTSFYFKYNSSNWSGEHFTPVFDMSGFTRTHEAEIWVQEPGRLGAQGVLAANSIYSRLFSLFQDGTRYNNAGVAVTSGTEAAQITALLA